MGSIDDGRPAGRTLRHLVAFVAIVWAVAGTFIAFELVSAKGMDFALDHPALFGRILLSPATRSSTACQLQPGEVHAAPVPGIGPSDARTASWLLGLRVGRDAQARMSTTVTPPVLQASAAGIVQLAGILNVPVPAGFAPAQIVHSNTEFVSTIEVDAQRTAHHLALRFSPQACQLYKLGALWGYATLARMSLAGERSIYAVEIRYYATELGLPLSLWHPLVERTPREATADQINKQSIALTGDITKYLSQ